MAKHKRTLVWKLECEHTRASIQRPVKAFQWYSTAQAENLKCYTYCLTCRISQRIVAGRLVKGHHGD